MFRYDKDMERVMLEKKKEVIKEITDLETSIIKKLSSITHKNHTDMCELLADYNRLDVKAKELDKLIENLSIKQHKRLVREISDILVLEGEELKAVQENLKAKLDAFYEFIENYSQPDMLEKNDTKSSFIKNNPFNLRVSANGTKSVEFPRGYNEIVLAENQSAINWAQAFTPYLTDGDSLYVEGAENIPKYNDTLTEIVLCSISHDGGSFTFARVFNGDGTYNLIVRGTNPYTYTLEVGYKIRRFTHTSFNPSFIGGRASPFTHLTIDKFFNVVWTEDIIVSGLDGTTYKLYVDEDGTVGAVNAEMTTLNLEHGIEEEDIAFSICDNIIHYE